MKPDKDKEKTAPKKTGGKVFDVRRPGKAPASPTSRPVIMGHKPEAQEAQVAVSGIGEARPLMAKRTIQIMPVGASAMETNVLPATDQTAAPSEARQPKLDKDKDALASVALDAVTNPPDLAVGDQSKSTGSSERKLQPPNTSELGPDAQAETSGLEKVEPALTPEERPTDTSSVPEETTESPQAQLEEDSAPEPNIEPLFDNSGIVVSTHDHHPRHHTLKVFGLLLLIILLAAVVVDVLLDLNLLKLEGIPHTDFL